MGQRNYTCVLLPLYLLSDFPPPLPKLNVYCTVQYIQTVCVWGGGGELCCRPYSAEFYTLFLAGFRTYQIASPTKTN
jgi:hypothetical protein